MRLMKLCCNPLRLFRRRIQSFEAIILFGLIISLLTLLLLDSNLEKTYLSYEKLVQNVNYGPERELAIGGVLGSFDIETRILKTRNAASIEYQSLLTVSKTGSGDELFDHFDTGNYRKPREKYRTPEAVVTVKTVLKIRKLIIFTVNEINLKLENEGNCMKFWANPLNIHEIQEIGIQGNPVRNYRIKFRIQPGHLVLEASIKEDGDYLKKPFTVGIQNELELISAQILDLDSQYGNNSHCIGATGFSEWLELCICPNDQLLQITEEIRNLSAVHEPELKTLRPNASMLITNYFSYGSPDFYLITPRRRIYHRFCNPNLNFLIVVHSSLYNYERRMDVRETYASPDQMKKNKFGLVFFLGLGKGGAGDEWSRNETLRNLTMEISEFDDIVVGDFVDSYTNLTLKHLSVYNWIYTFCMRRGTHPRWTIKADDDVLINLDIALQISEANPNIPLVGHVRSGNKRVPNWSSEWRHPRYLYIGDWFPVCYAGAIYMIQTKWIPKYLQASLTTPLFPADDVYVPGVLSLIIGICPLNFPVRYHLYMARLTPCNIKQSIGSIGGIFLNKTTPLDSIRVQWESLIGPEGTECRKIKPKLPLYFPKGGCFF